MNTYDYSIKKAGGKSAIWLAVLVAFGLAGCGEDPVASMSFHPVKGKVLLADGKPLTAGAVVFTAAKPTLTSTANLESDGSFAFKGNKEGLPEAEYKVRIEPGGTLGGTRGKVTLPFPGKYTDEDRSGLTATVRPGENKFEFTLTK